MSIETNCRFCERHNKQLVAAVAVAGQWAGGDTGIDPQWVPVCQNHLNRWFDDIDDEPRLPVFPLPNHLPIVTFGEDTDEDTLTSVMGTWCANFYLKDGAVLCARWSGLAKSEDRVDLRTWDAALDDYRGPMVEIPIADIERIEIL